MVEAGLGDFLFGGVCELHFKLCKEVKVGILDVVVDQVELFKSFEDSFDPSVDLWPFDEGKSYRDPSYWGFKPRTP